MCLVAWPQRIPARSEVRHQYIHAIDVVPTIYDLLDRTTHGDQTDTRRAPLRAKASSTPVTIRARQKRKPSFIPCSASAPSTIRGG